jgi:deoxyribonucleoside regulator
VAQQAAAHLNTLVQPDSVLGVAWGTTLAAVVDCLIQKPVRGLDVVQLNGSATLGNIENAFGESIVSRLAQNFGGRAHSFPVPAFFDFAATREALWRERSIQSLRSLQDRAELLVFSIGARQTGSHVHTGDYLDAAGLQSLQDDGVVGDIATVFFRADGSWRDIALNARSSGLALDRFQRAQHALCVVSGQGKVAGLRAALNGGFINELVMDEPSALLLMDGEAAP